MTPTKDPNNELDELLNQEFACGWCNKYSQLHQSDFDKFKLELTALIDKKVTEASEAQFKLGYEAGVSATNGTLKGISWKEARAQLSKPKEEER